MSYKVSFVTRKTYTDGTEKITVKNGYLPNPEKVQRTKRRNKFFKELELQRIEPKGQLSFDSLEKERELKAEFEKKYAPKLSNAVRAMNRSKNNLMDILRCNILISLLHLHLTIKRLTATTIRLRARHSKSGAITFATSFPKWSM